MAIAPLRDAFENGVAILDTAEAHGPFADEDLVGEGLVDQKVSP
jgi:aryl-alcohol dehydrogenase-like predicted oxidoreductase